LMLNAAVAKLTAGTSATQIVGLAKNY